MTYPQSSSLVENVKASFFAISKFKITASAQLWNFIVYYMAQVEFPHNHKVALLSTQLPAMGTSLDRTYSVTQVTQPECNGQIVFLRPKYLGFFTTLMVLVWVFLVTLI